MRKSWLLCVLLGTLAWGQAAPGAPPPPARQAPAAPPDMSASVPADAAVITVNGVCPAQPKTQAPAAKGAAAKPATAAKVPAAKTPADCKTIVTKAEFEKLANGLSPSVTPQMKKQLANVLPQLIAMSSEAKKKGLDKSPRYEELLKFYKMQILRNEVQRSIQEEGAKVPSEEIAAYYKEHAETFEVYNLDRLFVPRSKQDNEEEKEESEKEAKMSEEEKKAEQAKEKQEAEEGEQAMSKLAESLRARAAAGEDIMKLQKEAFDAGGMKIESPTANLPKVRRTGLPPAHAVVFELKPGDVSQVISDSGGHYIYKLNSKDMLTLDQAKDEIHTTLQNQRTRELMEKVNNSFKVETNEAYFGPGGPGPGMVPPPRIQNRQNAPAGPIGGQTPPPAPTPAAKPN